MSELIFITTDNYNKSDFINEDELFVKYMNEDENGFYGLESIILDRNENIIKLINFLFNKSVESIETKLSENISIFNLSNLIGKNISFNQLENNYEKWIKISNRNNTMDEYGTLNGLISFLERNSSKKQLILRVEKKNTVPNTVYN